MYLACLAVAPAMAQLPSKKKVVVSGNIEIAYAEIGPATGVPIVFLHGFTDTGRSFQYMAAEINKLNDSYRLIIPDLRGHGGSSRPPFQAWAAKPDSCFSQALMAQDVFSLLDQLEISQTWVVGHSMGSMVAQQMVLQQPARVKGTVLIGTFVNGREAGVVKWLKDDLIEGDWKNRLAAQNVRWPEAAYDLTPASMGQDVVQFLRANWVNEFQAPEIFLDQVLPETINTPLSTWIGVIRALAQTDTRAIWKNWQVPTLILWPIQDMAFPASEQAAVKETFAKAGRAYNTPIYFKTYGLAPLSENGPTDFGHNLHWAAPVQTAEDIVNFISKGTPAEGTPYLDPQRNFQIAVDQKNNAWVLLK